jgi:hypothetical protein
LFLNTEKLTMMTKALDYSGNCFYVLLVKGEPQPWNNPPPTRKEGDETPQP